MLQDESRSCLISYIDRNYIGFRKLTIEGPWKLGDVPEIVVSDEDTNGVCLNISTDAFFEFEDAVSWP